jgi:hypothetical protein
MTHASRDTTTGALWEERVKMQAQGIDISKHALYRFLDSYNIKWNELISCKLLPDEAYYDQDTNSVVIYEKKYQHKNGSADEKLQTCAFKISQYKKLFASFNLTHISYIYVLNDWFEQPKYTDVLNYIRTVEDCDYIIIKD